MKSYDALELAARNLRESMLRNSLTTMGIAVGVASLVAMLSLGVGLQQLANRRLTRSGLFNTVIVFQQRDFEGATGRPRDSSESRPVDTNARQEISKLPNVLEVYPEIRFPAEILHFGKSHFAAISALPPSARESDAFDNMKGSFFSGPKVEEAVLQADFAKQLNKDPAALLGQQIALRYAERQPASASAQGEQAEIMQGFSVLPRELKLRVVGIIENEPYGGIRGMARGGVFIPMQLAESMNIMQQSDLRNAMRGKADTPTYASLVVHVSGAKNVEPVEEAIKKMHFATFSLLDASRNLRRFFAILDLFLGIFGSLALAVASLGIINTLVMAILERRREIGIMKAIGASDGDVRGLFFAEAGAMGAVGGVMGVALGWSIGRVIDMGTNIYLQRQQLPPEQIWAVPWWLVAGAIGFAVVVSLLSGLYPAARAARLDPVQALRYE